LKNRMKPPQMHGWIDCAQRMLELSRFLPPPPL
jgi:hypothetical protein